MKMNTTSDQYSHMFGFNNKREIPHPNHSKQNVFSTGLRLHLMIKSLFVKDIK